MTDTTAPRTAAPDLARLRTLAEAATPGRWAWFWTKYETYLATVDRGRIFVMGFARHGMNGAEPMFQVRDGSGNGSMVKASELGWDGLRAHPDAAYIAALDPTTVLALLDRAEAIEPLLALVRAAGELAAFPSEVERSDRAITWFAANLPRLRRLRAITDALPPEIVAAAGTSG